MTLTHAIELLTELRDSEGDSIYAGAIDFILADSALVRGAMAEHCVQCPQCHNAILSPPKAHRNDCAYLSSEGDDDCDCE